MFKDMKFFETVCSEIKLHVKSTRTVSEFCHWVKRFANQTLVEMFSNKSGKPISTVQAWIDVLTDLYANLPGEKGYGPVMLLVAQVGDLALSKMRFFVAFSEPLTKTQVKLFEDKLNTTLESINGHLAELVWR